MTHTDYSNICCIGFIMDGNRRWAKEQGLSAYEGHKKGFDKLKEVVAWVQEAHIKQVVMYAFSSENWNRSKEEVGYLMGIFTHVLEHEVKKMIDNQVRVRFIGDRSHFNETIRSLMHDAELASVHNQGITLHLAMSYGGRAEIVAAVNACVKDNKTSITEDEFGKRLWSGDMPDPDLIVRTSGEKRLSNFLPWQSIYSELFFTDTKWPAFSKEEFHTILDEFAMRERRRGK